MLLPELSDKKQLLKNQPLLLHTYIRKSCIMSKYQTLASFSSRKQKSSSCLDFLSVHVLNDAGLNSKNMIIAAMEADEPIQTTESELYPNRVKRLPRASHGDEVKSELSQTYSALMRINSPNVQWQKTNRILQRVYLTKRKP